MAMNDIRLTGLTPEEISGQSGTMQSLGTASSTAKKKNPPQPQLNVDRSGDALGRIRGRELPTLSLGEGPGTQRIYESTQYLRDTPQGRVTTAQYATPREAASYIKGLQRQLGLKGPQSTIDATRTAAEQELDRGAYMASIADAQKLAQQGQSTGARSQALSALRGTELAGQKAQLEAQLQGQEAQQLQDYERMLLGAAQQQGGALTSAEQEAARAKTQASFANAKAEADRQLEKAKMSLSSGDAINAEEYRRRMTEYQNALAKVQQLNTADILEINKDAQTQANWMNFLGGVVDAGTRVGTAAL